jgi:hypothetical protein
MFKVSKMDGDFNDNLELFLKDNSKFIGKEETEREKGIACGMEFLKVCDEVWCLSGATTKGMYEEMDLANWFGIPVVFISL